MSDAYGAIIFSKSNDCIIDGTMLADALNEFNWANEEAHWIYSEINDSLQINSYHLQYPVALPEFEEFVHVRDSNGIWTTYNASEVNHDALDLPTCSSYSPYSLKELSRRLSPHVKNGWIEISCNANEKSRYCYFQSLRVYSNGATKKRNIWTGARTEPIDENESYEPEF